MRHTHVIGKILALGLVAILLMGMLTACGDKTEQRGKTVVGEVDGNDIYYDELYALAQLYLPEAKAEAGEDPVQQEQALDRLIRKNIISNTAILRLCEKAGLSYDESSLSDAVDVELTKMITQSFDGDRDAYRESMKENGLTERYVRYSLGLTILYDQLLIQYPSLGLVDDNDTIKDYIQKNFIHVYHLVLFFNENNQAEKLAKITEAQEALQSGEKTMYALIKAGYSEDFLDPSGDGYYIAKGTMDERYEEAAFSLKLNEVSDVIESEGTNNNGYTSPCYYVIQRVAIDEAYVDSHLSELANEYYSSVIYGDLTKLQESLTFEPNSFYEGLTLSKLLPAKDGMSTGAVVAICVGCVALLIGAVVVAVILIRKKPKDTPKAMPEKTSDGKTEEKKEKNDQQTTDSAKKKTNDSNKE